jgi:hypothetical protein
MDEDPMDKPNRSGHPERRIETLRLIRAPHAAIMIATYQRLIDRKKGFLRNWGLKGLDDT